jgi:hypothetical protein
MSPFPVEMAAFPGWKTGKIRGLQLPIRHWAGITNNLLRASYKRCKGQKMASTGGRGAWGVQTGHIPDRLGRPERDLFLHSSIVRAGREMLCKPRGGSVSDGGVSW